MLGVVKILSVALTMDKINKIMSATDEVKVVPHVDVTVPPPGLSPLIRVLPKPKPY